MKSKTSLFSPGLSRNILSRLWPLWLIYLGVLLVQLPVAVSGYVSQGISARYTMECILQLAVDVAGYAMAASLLSVMAVFSYLYSKRSCSLINSLPIRRETAFITACLTGMLPLLLAEVFVWLWAMKGLIGGSGLIQTEDLNTWLLTVAFSTLASYGFAVFCAMLTGKLLVVPVLFLVLNVAKFLLRFLIHDLLYSLIYGYCWGDVPFSCLSPIIYALDKIRVVKADPELGGVQAVRYVLQGLDILGWYALAGLAFMGLALLLYRRRNMENTGDLVAIKILQPVFKFCCSIYTALIFTYIATDFLTTGPLRGAAGTARLILLLMIGSALGFYAAEMLLQKSLRVFRSRIRGLIVVWAVFLLGVVVAELDLTGYERRVPETEEIQSVVLVNDGRVTEDAESIKLTRKIHQTAIDNEEHNRQAESTSIIYIRYELKDGSSLGRSYRVDRSRDWVDNSGRSEYALCRELYMLPQNKKLLLQTDIPVEPEFIVMGAVNIMQEDEFNGYVYVSSYEEKVLSPQQAYELYSQCVLPDIEEFSLGSRQLFMGGKDYELLSNIGFRIDLVMVDQDNVEDRRYTAFSIDITMDAERTLAWLEENLGIEAKPYLEVRPDALEDLEYY